MEIQSKIISVQLSDGTLIRVEATSIGDRKVNSQIRPFSEISTAIKILCKEIAETLQNVQPDKASVRFGIDIAVEAGKITPLLVKGNNTANLEIILEWGK